jgi:Trk-type K+ transport system membrane component
LGFLVLAEITGWLPDRHRRWGQLSLHSKIVLATTGGLLAAGFLAVLCMEWSNTLVPSDPSPAAAGRRVPVRHHPDRRL